MTLTPGARLGPYEIGALISGGVMGQVYRAVDTRLKRAVAIKVIASRYVDSPELRSRFRAEAEAIAAVTHPYGKRFLMVSADRRPPVDRLELTLNLLRAPRPAQSSR